MIKTSFFLLNVTLVGLVFVASINIMVVKYTPPFRLFGNGQYNNE